MVIIIAKLAKLKLAKKNDHSTKILLKKYHK